MPTYEFRCPDGHEFERFYRKISDARAELRLPGLRARWPRGSMSAGAGLVFKGRDSTSRTTARTRTRTRPRRRAIGAERRVRRRASREGVDSGVQVAERRARHEGRSGERSRSLASVRKPSPRPRQARGRSKPSSRADEERTRMNAADQIRAELVARGAQSLGAPDDVEPLLERPRDPSFGDWATNLAMVLAQAARHEAARDRASSSSSASTSTRAGVSERRDRRARASSTSGSTPDVFATGSRDIVAADEQYGRATTRAAARRSNVEFVSANPTGPLHVGHGRQAALGDAIATLLEGPAGTSRASSTTTTPARRSTNLALSVAGARARARRRDARDSRGRLSRRVHPRDRRALRRRASGRPERRRPRRDARASPCGELRKEQDLDLQAFGVQVRRYFLESSLYTDGRVDDDGRAR